jgi:hypothetical protein
MKKPLKGQDKTANKLSTRSQEPAVTTDPGPHCRGGDGCHFCMRRALCEKEAGAN